jgi:hypothetical protein
VEVPKGTSAAWLPGAGRPEKDPDEELLLSDGLRIRIADVHWEGRILVIEAQVKE